MTRWNPEPAITRALRRVEVDPVTSCWVWPGSKNSSGYGSIRDDNGRQIKVHRLLWRSQGWVVPDGLVLDHLCRNRLCCNPDHLEPVTQRENILRGASPTAVASSTGICQRGHALTQERDQRVCRVCRAARMRMARKRATT